MSKQRASRPPDELAFSCGHVVQLLKIGACLLTKKKPPQKTRNSHVSVFNLAVLRKKVVISEGTALPDFSASEIEEQMKQLEGDPSTEN